MGTNRSEIYGIDLGTTNSCIAVLENGRPRVIPVDGDGIVPSIVSFDGKAMLVGRRAKNRAAAFPEQSVRSIKRSMGGDAKRVLGGKSYSPEDISAMILRYLCDEAEKLEGQKVERVVVTVPAYFSDAQRRATREAGVRAGLSVERIINEPTAAALFYDHIDTSEKRFKSGSGNEERHVLVYDLGGGTFDVSVLRMGEIVEVLASTGDTHLGGDDFDVRIVRSLLEDIRRREHTDPGGHVPAVARLVGSAEQAKIDLSRHASTWIRENHVPLPGGKSCSVSLELSRESFEEMTRDLQQRTEEFVHKALVEAELRHDQIDRVILVGGMTRMPAIPALLESIFGDTSMPVVDPDRSVALGAAIQGGIIEGVHCDQILVDVTPHTLSVAAYDEERQELVCCPIIPRNTQIPAKRARTFFTICDNQPMVEIQVYQGESRCPRENALLGDGTLSLAKAEANCPVIVEYSYDLDGIVHVVAEQKGYSRKTEVRIDSRHPGKAFSQALDELRDEEAQDEDEAPASMTNFVTARARMMLQKMPQGDERDALAALLSRYEKALADESDDLDDIEDELLSAMEGESEE